MYAYGGSWSRINEKITKSANRVPQFRDYLHYKQWTLMTAYFLYIYPVLLASWISAALFSHPNGYGKARSSRPASTSPLDSRYLGANGKEWFGMIARLWGMKCEATAELCRGGICDGGSLSRDYRFWLPLYCAIHCSLHQNGILLLRKRWNVRASCRLLHKKWRRRKMKQA